MSTSIPLVEPSRQSADIRATLTNWPDGLPILPESTPTSALDAALILAEVGGVFAVDLYAPDGKKPIMRAYQDVVSWPRRDADGTFRNSTRNADAIAQWFGPRGCYGAARYGVGLALRDAEAVALDIDDARGAVQLAALVTAGGGWGGPTFAIASTRGPKLLYHRPADLAGLNNVKPRAKREVDRVGLAAVDVVLHYVLAWAPGRRWYGLPADIADLPGGGL